MDYILLMSCLSYVSVFASIAILVVIFAKKHTLEQLSKFHFRVFIEKDPALRDVHFAANVMHIFIIGLFISYLMRSGLPSDEIASDFFITIINLMMFFIDLKFLILQSQISKNQDVEIIIIDHTKKTD